MNPMSPMRSVVIKLGGAFFSDKNKPGVVHHGKLSRFCSDLAHVMENDARSAGVSVLLVSGGGSIGHHAASRYKVTEGALGCDLRNVYRMSRAMFEMKSDLCERFAGLGVAAFPLQEAALLSVNSQGTLDLDIAQLGLILSLGMMPVMSGGFVFSQSTGVAALNGDRLVMQLGLERDLGVERALFLSGEDGLLDGDLNPVPVLYPDQESFAMQLVRDFPRAGLDVTGGMRTKLESCFALARAGVETRIFSGNTCVRETLASSLFGQTDIGTLFHPEKSKQYECLQP